MGITARARYVRVSPRKARLVTELVKGKKVEEALSILAFTRKAFAKTLTKLINSALANARQNSQLDVDTLVVKKIAVDGGPVAKRFIPRALGRATKVRKRTSHITVVLDQR